MSDTYATEAELREENTYLRDIVANLTGGGKPPIDGLTRLPSRIVRTLEKASGRFLRNSTIIDAIYWDRPNGSPGGHIIPAYVYIIRRDRPDIGKRLQNKPGYGYRLEAGDG